MGSDNPAALQAVVAHAGSNSVSRYRAVVTQQGVVSEIPVTFSNEFRVVDTVPRAT